MKKAALTAAFWYRQWRDLGQSGLHQARRHSAVVLTTSTSLETGHHHAHLLRALVGEGTHQLSHQGAETSLVQLLWQVGCEQLFLDSQDGNPCVCLRQCGQCFIDAPECRAGCKNPSRNRSGYS